MVVAKRVGLWVKIQKYVIKLRYSYKRYYLHPLSFLLERKYHFMMYIKGNNLIALLQRNESKLIVSVEFIESLHYIYIYIYILYIKNTCMTSQKNFKVVYSAFLF